MSRDTLFAAMGRSGAVFSAAVGLVAAGTAVPIAVAAPPPQNTGSAITSPADSAELFYNGDNGSGSVTVRGTFAGANQQTTADLRCYSADDTSSTRLASGVDVSSGSFAVVVSLSSIAGEACRLRMVPAGLNPTGPAAAPFAGPAVSISDQFSHSSNGNLYGYYILSGSLPWSFALQSLAECSVSASFATSTPDLSSFQLFAGDVCLPEQSGIAPNLRSRSALQVDGLNAYPPAAISPPPSGSSPDLTGVAGFEPLQYSARFDSNHDTVSITESDTPTICNPEQAFPPTPSSCPLLRDSEIRFDQTTTVLPGGQVARVTDTATNVGTSPHTVDALFGQSIIAPATGELPGFEFPSQQSFTAHAEPDSFSQFGSGAGSIIAIGDAAAPPSSSNPIGAITFNRPPQSANFISSNGSQTASFVMHYIDTIAPGASVTYVWSFSQATTASALAALEQVERDRFSVPTISIRYPHRGSVLRARHPTVRGSVSDPIGLRSVTVNGRPAPLGNGGTFSTTITLKPGRRRIVAVVTNLGGNTQHASVRVTYRPRPCRVPKLRGLKLRAGRKALANASCTVGKVIRVRSRRIRAGRIVRTSPAPGSRHKPFARVRVYVSRGRRR
jgi:hypothetical protein